MRPVEDILRAHLDAYAATVPTSRPDLAGAARAARRAHRRRTGMTATAAAAALVLIVGGTLELSKHTGSRTEPAVTPGQPAADVTRVPGFTELPGVTLPARVAPTDVAAERDEIWVSGNLLAPPNGTTATGVLLHGKAGSPLVPVDNGEYFQAPVLRDGHAFVIRLGATGGSTLQERDATTGTLQHEVPLTAYGADGAAITPSGNGTGPLAVVLSSSLRPGPGGVSAVAGKLRVGILSDDGTVTHLTPVVHGGTYVPGDADGNGLNPLVTISAGSPRYLFYANTRLDLRTGRQQLENPTPKRPAATNGAAAVAELGGKVVYASLSGVVYAGDPDSLTPTVVDTPTGSNPLDPSSDLPPHLTLVNGRLFLTPAEPAATGTAVPQPVTELDPATLQPNSSTGVIAGDALTNGQTLAAYAPAGQVGHTGTGGVIRLLTPGNS